MNKENYFNTFSRNHIIKIVKNKQKLTERVHNQQDKRVEYSAYYKQISNGKKQRIKIPTKEQYLSKIMRKKFSKNSINHYKRKIKGLQNTKKSPRGINAKYSRNKQISKIN